MPLPQERQHGCGRPGRAGAAELTSASRARPAHERAAQAGSREAAGRAVVPLRRGRLVRLRGGNPVELRTLTRSGATPGTQRAVRPPASLWWTPPAQGGRTRRRRDDQAGAACGSQALRAAFSVGGRGREGGSSGPRHALRPRR